MRLPHPHYSHQRRKPTVGGVHGHFAGTTVTTKIHWIPPPLQIERTGAANLSSVGIFGFALFTERASTSKHKFVIKRDLDSSTPTLVNAVFRANPKSCNLCRLLRWCRSTRPTELILLFYLSRCVARASIECREVNVFVSPSPYQSIPHLDLSFVRAVIGFTARHLFCTVCVNNDVEKDTTGSFQENPPPKISKNISDNGPIIPLNVIVFSERTRPITRDFPALRCGRNNPFAPHHETRPEDFFCPCLS